MLVFLRRTRRALSLLWLVALTLGLLLLAASPLRAQEGGDQTVDVVQLEGVIDPTNADYLRGRLEGSQADDVHAVIIQLDTPGGLDVSMRDMIQELLEADLPTIVWIAPGGARAASAGTFITYAANLAYMSAGTELGAATPVNLGGGETNETLTRKATNDAAAFIEELAILRDRDPEFARAAVEDAESIGATEAVERDVVNGLANTLSDLLEAIDGQTVTIGDGTSATLETWDDASDAASVRLRFQEMNLLQRLLHLVTNPEIAYLLLLFGTFGIIFELYNPGIGLAGILGGVCLLLGFYALSVLPTNWAGVFLIVLSVIFFVVDLQVAGLGIWTVGGVVALVAGGLLLFAGAPDALSLSPWAIVTAVVLTLLFFISVMTAALRVRLRRPITGEDALVGTVGEAKTDIAPEGTVLTKGTLWRARTMETGIAAGAMVEVKATEGLVLLVEPVEDHEHARNGRDTS
ncbi:MAG: NfeD family protein [Actinomycetota bacterium]